MVSAKHPVSFEILEAKKQLLILDKEIYKCLRDLENLRKKRAELRSIGRYTTNNLLI